MKEKYLEIFEQCTDELDIKIAQHNIGIKFTAQQMQNIRTVRANMNFALETLKEYCEKEEMTDLQGKVQGYNSGVDAIENANKNNKDKHNYLQQQDSPNRYGKKKPAPPPVLGIKREITKSSSSTAHKNFETLAYYVLQQNNKAKKGTGDNASHVEGLTASLETMKL